MQLLIQCPECELQISDKALYCPHCGYPMVKQAKPFIPSNVTRHKRLPNGFGQITEIKNKNLRNRFRVMITVSKTAEGRPICKLLKPKAYFATYNEAYSALVEYNKDPYSLDNVVTLEELYDAWSKEYKKKITPDSFRNYASAWNYCKPLYKRGIKELRTGHLKEFINNAEVERKGKTIKATAYTKKHIKILLNAMFDYAESYDLVDKNYARAFELPEDVTKELNSVEQAHIAFDDFEMKILWDNYENIEYVGYVLYQCYSGWRPTELCRIALENVHLDEGYIVGGIKTESGRERIVPIHPKVKHIVEREYKRAKSLKCPYLFTYLNSNNRTGSLNLNYERYKNIFKGIVRALNLNPDHDPHDGRKTFITMAKKYKMDEYALKRIAGHRIDDITEAIYTERSLDWYIEEMQKIK